ncbi:antitoxin HipB [uncultured Eubacterium sp.]|uniref:helix-turn-helix domain-containing protein n=1 Tax=Emergencia sp. TaxID=1926557 RepID=UPI000821858B|nr:antitoxin HipB [uncultured Eubacterium sp.]
MDELDFLKVGMEMKRLRTAHAFTQEQVAADLGCTVAFISNIENNRTKLNLRVLFYYSKLFHVSVDSILNAGRDDVDADAASKSREEELLRIFHQFSEEEQKKIIEILEFVKNGDAKSL